MNNVRYALRKRDTGYFYEHFRGDLCVRIGDTKPNANTALYTSLAELVKDWRAQDIQNAEFVEVTLCEKPGEPTLTEKLDGPGRFVIISDDRNNRWYVTSKTGVSSNLPDARLFDSPDEAVRYIGMCVQQPPTGIRRVVEGKPTITYKWEVLK